MNVAIPPIVEVPQGPNVTIDVTGEQAMEIDALVNDAQPNGVVVEQQQAQATVQQLPPLFDMDLERMHSELFRGRYLTPQDFMDDIGKMVHNADVRSHEDLDRLYKAQAMFTAAEVSIQEFDSQFRLECERMAVRERQRRDERKKEKGKEREQQQQATAPIPIRRSARANGLEPEHPITDPVKLERRLKRQRGELDGTGGDSLNTSEGEANADPATSYQGRDAKRTRILEERDDGRDPLDTLGRTPNSEVRSHVVRFVTGPLDSPLGAEPPQQTHLSPQMHSNHLRPFPNLTFHSLQSSPVPDLQLGLRPSAGFNPALLNPVQPSERQPFASPIPLSPNPGPSRSPVPVDPADPFISQPHPQYPYLSPEVLLARNVIRGLTPPVVGSTQSSTLVPRHASARSSRHPTPMIIGPTAESVVHPPESTPMEVVVAERIWTPLPDFHVSRGLVDELGRMFRVETGRLTIEQLEQLRATCLGAVWRERKEWDRDRLVGELVKLVRAFVLEVEGSDSESEQDG